MMKTAPYMAVKLAAAARHRNLEPRYHYFTRMREICQKRHGQYATDKIPGFGGNAPVTHSH